MRILRRVILLVGVCATLLHCAGWTVSSGTVANTVSDFRHVVPDRCEGRSSVLQAICRRSHAAAGTIETVARSSEQRVSIEYLMSVRSNMRAVIHGLAASNQDVRLALMTFGTRGLELKADVARLQAGRWGKPIRVIIQTHNPDGVPVNGLTVRSRPRVWGRRPRRWRKFSTKSTPAIQLLFPNPYDIAVGRHPPIEIDVGVDGEIEKIVVLRIP